MSEQYEIEDADHFSVAAIGEPGQRVFLVQAGKGALTVTLKVEKAQVAALVAYLVRLLQGLPADVAPVDMPEIPPEASPDFVVGALAPPEYDDVTDRVVLVAVELVGEDEPASGARFVVTRAQAAAFAKEGRRLVEGGRPPCPFCGYPLDQRGHVCPRTNGSHPPLT